MSEPPLKHTAEQYGRLIRVCEHAKREDTYDDFREAEEAFLALEPSVATRKLEQLFGTLYGSLDKMREIIAELYRLRSRAQQEEDLEQSRRRRRG